MLYSKIISDIASKNRKYSLLYIYLSLKCTTETCIYVYQIVSKQTINVGCVHSPSPKGTLNFIIKYSTIQSSSNACDLDP